MTESWVWELNNHIHNRVPDPVDYIEMRRKTFGSDLTMSLSRLSKGDACRRSCLRHPHDARAGELRGGLRLLVNDIFSYQKEIQFEGELNNCVLVVQNFLDVDTDAAVPWSTT